MLRKAVKIPQIHNVRFGRARDRPVLGQSVSLREGRTTSARYRIEDFRACPYYYAYADRRCSDGSNESIGCAETPYFTIFNNPDRWGRQITVRNNLGTIMELKNKLEIIDMSLGIAAKIGITVGSLILVCYCWSIDFFPKDISVGDGLLFIFVAVGFGTVYLFFVASLTSLGVLLRPLWYVLQSSGIWIGERWAKLRNKTLSYEPFDLKPGGLEHLTFAAFGLILVTLFSIKDVSRLPTLLLASFGCALLWSSYQDVDAKLRKISSSPQPSDGERERIPRLEKSKALLPWLIISIPLLIGGVSGEMTSGTMRLLMLRNDDATAHIKKPYATILSTSGITGAKSEIGDDYLRYEHAEILFSGLGSTTVVSLKNLNGSSMKLTIPSDHILFFANHSLQQTR